MVKDGIGRVVAAGKSKTRYVSIPSDVAGDDRFPFKTGEEVKVSIIPEKKILQIEKAE